MDEKEVQHILIEILCAAVNGGDDNESIKEKITPDILLTVYRLAKKHDLAHVVSGFLRRTKVDIDQEFLTKLQQEEIVSIYRYEQLNYAFEEICNAFDESNISYIPLKGAVLRKYYPYASMRTSCDIDILIHEEDLENAISCLENKGYCRGPRNYHDVSLFSPNKIHLELHFNIQENMDNLDLVLKDAWEYAVPTNSSQYAFSKEFFAFYIFAHMAYHFVSGGCGIRYLLDIWVMEHNMGIPFSCAKVLLEKAGIYQFAIEMSKLAEQCFSCNNIDAFSDLVLKYIFQGGVYGSVENRIAVNKSKSKSFTAYVIKRLFLPYKSMITQYPFLQRFPYLLPFCWFIRWIKALFCGKSKRLVSEMLCVNNIPDKKTEELKFMSSRLGL